MEIYRKIEDQNYRKIELGQFIDVHDLDRFLEEIDLVFRSHTNPKHICEVVPVKLVLETV